MDTVEDTTPVKTVPVITPTRIRNISITNDDATSNSVMSLNEESTWQLDIPPAISPLRNESTEVCILLCASNQAAALKMSKIFSEAKLLGPHSSNKRHHFYFSTKLPTENLPLHC